jgi:hypothetical protein
LDQGIPLFGYGVGNNKGRGLKTQRGKDNGIFFMSDK